MFRLLRQRPTPLSTVHWADLAALNPAQQAERFAGPDRHWWIEAAARYGLVEAQVLLGQLLLDSGNPSLARRWFGAAAAAGFPPAINMLGRCCELGWGMPPDPTAAAIHYREAAEAGLDWGQFNLACLLLYGLGGTRDWTEARAWFERAAAQGHAKAVNMLARFAEEGWTAPPDPTAAAHLYECAAIAGDFRAQYNFATILAARGDETRAVEWLRKSLATGSPDFRAAAVDALQNHPSPVLRACALRHGAATGSNQKVT